MVKRVAVAFNDKEYEQLMRVCSDCRPIETPYGFIKQLVLNEIREKQDARETEKGKRVNLGEVERDGETFNYHGETATIIEDLDSEEYT